MARMMLNASVIGGVSIGAEVHDTPIGQMYMNAMAPLPGIAIPSGIPVTIVQGTINPVIPAVVPRTPIDLPRLVRMRRAQSNPPYYTHRIPNYVEDPNVDAPPQEPFQTLGGTYLGTFGTQIPAWAMAERELDQFRLDDQIITAQIAAGSSSGAGSSSAHAAEPGPGTML